MKKVKRGNEPNSLVKNGKNWTNELLAAISQKKDRKEIDGIYKKLNKDDVKSALGKMYKGICCYCEANIETVSYPHIEHREPKARSKFPKKAFEWDNLHLACEKCNKKKGSKWNRKDKILDAVKDDIDCHLTYEVTDLGLMRRFLTMRGMTTVDHPDLNRNKLPEERAVYLNWIRKFIDDFNDLIRIDSDSIEAQNIFGDLRYRYKDTFGSVVKWAVDKWLIRD